MGKLNGFLEIERFSCQDLDVQSRITHFDEFHVHQDIDKQSLQAARCMDCGVPFCQNGKMMNGMVSGCPLNNLIPEWNDSLYHKQYDEGLKRLLKTNIFPEFTSRVCPALCEGACTCSLHGEAVTVRNNEYALIEYGYKNDLVGPHVPTQRVDQSVAVVGSGPAGLAAAYQLNQRGYHVTVYEKADRLGGLLMYGIPNMKLDKSIIDRRIDLMKKEGIEFKVNSPIESKEDADHLINQYDSIVLACGARKPRDINVKGRDAKGVYFAVDYLSQVTKSLLDSNLENKNYIETKDKNVLIIGGGDTGNDCVATAIRLGCQSVVQLEMMGELPEVRSENNPWPEYPRIKKVDYGQEESIHVFKQDPRIYNSTIKEIITDEFNQVKQVVYVSLKRENNRFVEIEGSEKVIDVDLILIAAGFVGCENAITNAFELDLTDRGTVSEKGFKTPKEKIYTCGDMRRGQSLVVWAIQEGLRVAKRVDFDLTFKRK